MSTRPTRRAATRRTTVVESDDDELSQAVKVQAAEEDYENDAAPTAKRATRSTRRSAAPASAPAPTTRTRTTRTRKPSGTVSKKEAAIAAAAIEPDEVVEAMEADSSIPDAKPEPQSPEITPPSASRNRREQTPRESIPPAPGVTPATPKPAPSSPLAVQKQASPLADITPARLNTHTVQNTPGTLKPMKSIDAFLDKPLDIVVKQRTMAIPLVEDTAPKSRIVLTHLILINFKSYAGRQEVGPFHASFSSVVGPNGSGKSNVIDSLLFVFGFRASKMRQGKISALIHNSAQYSDLDHCEVAVHFQEVMDQVGFNSLSLFFLASY